MRSTKSQYYAGQPRLTNRDPTRTSQTGSAVKRGNGKLAKRNLGGLNSRHWTTRWVQRPFRRDSVVFQQSPVLEHALAVCDRLFPRKMRLTECLELVIQDSALFSESAPFGGQVTEFLHRCHGIVNCA